MNRRWILRFLVLPVAAGLAAVAVLTYALKPGERAGRPAAEETVGVVVARRAVPADTVLAPGDLEVRRVARDLAVAGTLSAADQAVGKRTTVNLAEGQPVLKSLLDLPENRGGLAPRVPEGLRAITFAVNDLTGLAGRLQAGDRVDVVAFVQGKEGAGARATLLLERVLVLALGRAQDEAAGGGPSKPSPPYASVTVAVRPEEAVLLTLAQRQSQLQLLLRPAGEEGVKGRIAVTEDALR